MRNMTANLSQLLRKAILCMLLVLGLSARLNAQFVLIPDTNFRNALINVGFSSCITGNYLDTTCPLLFTPAPKIYVDYRNIYSVEGLQYFKGMESFSCNNNHISVLPVLPNSLKILYCGSNLLTSLPALPNNLEYLFCDHNFISTLPNFPNSLKDLNCNNNLLTTLPPIVNTNLFKITCDSNKISSLPNLPILLTDLSCAHNHLTSLPSLPNFNYFLKNPNPVIDCSYNQLTSLPTLPDSLFDLFCNGNNLWYIPTLPSNLFWLQCNDNKLLNLPTLPTSLNILICSRNLLTSLPALPQHLDRLDCSNNNLLSIPEFPDGLSFLSCSNNSTLQCLPRLKIITYFSFTNTGITCLPNYGTIQYSNPSLFSIPLCDYINTNGCTTYWNISGNTYFDVNSDCIKNNGDLPQYNAHILLYDSSQSLIQQAFTGGEGYFSFKTDTSGIYYTTIDTSNIPFTVQCPAIQSYKDTLPTTISSVYDRNFGLKCKTGFDLTAYSIYSEKNLVPGHNSLMKVKAGDLANLYGVHCANGISGTVKIIFNGPIAFVTAASGALIPVVNGDTLLYSVPNFGSINLTQAFNFIISTDSTALFGDQICFTVSVLPLIGDNDTTNNEVTRCYSVRSSFDPNEKSVYPKDFLDANGDHWLHYTIQFQNTGNAVAENIHIVDTLDTNLNLSTFQLISYSHQPYVQIFEGGIARFIFSNINLPDSNSNEPFSHGYVEYKIKAKDSLPSGTEIKNTAHIYFDLNSPVTTNTVSNTAVLCAQNVNDFTASICQGEQYNFDGMLIDKEGSYSKYYPTTSGCDSLAILHLDVRPPLKYYILDTICHGQKIIFGNDTIKESGSYTKLFSDSPGCDSIITLKLTATQPIPNNIASTICSGQYSQFGSLQLTLSGYYSDTLTATSGCDSIVRLHLTVTPPIISNVYDSICYGHFYQLGTKHLFTSGWYIDTLSTINGCDSIVNLHLFVKPFPVNLSVTISNGNLISLATNSTYQWYNCNAGNIISNAISQVYHPNHSGDYAVIVTNGPCSDTSQCYNIAFTGLNENNFSDIQVLPNPSHEIFNVKFPEYLNGKEFNLEVTDMLGKEIEKIKVLNGETILNAQKWETGIYLLKISSNDGSTTIRKLIKN